MKKTEFYNSVNAVKMVNIFFKMNLFTKSQNNDC